MKNLSKFVLESLNYDSKDYTYFEIKNDKDLKKLKINPDTFGYVFEIELPNGKAVYLGKTESGKFISLNDVEEDKMFEAFSEKDLNNGFAGSLGIKNKMNGNKISVIKIFK